MGKLWRNRDFRIATAVCALAAAVALPLCVWLHPLAGALAAALFLAVYAVFARLTVRRYRELARLSDELARIAAGRYELDIAEYAEGELSILASELLKITAALAHQAESSQRDKRLLADSLADISHQLKTPLTSLLVMSELLADPGLSEDKRREFLTGMRGSLERMQWLIAALLKLSRLDAGAVRFAVEDVALADVVARAAAPLRVPVELKEQSLRITGEQGLRIHSDPGWLSEALGNLLKNCVEHTPPGGTIRVECVETPLYTALTVLDDGPGIDPEDLPRIFERFYRGKNAGADSVGIGLALSRAIVLALGGTLEAANRPEGGSVFALKLYHGVR